MVNTNIENDGRFKYKPLKKKPQLRKYLTYSIPIIAIALLLIFLWLIPSWFAPINLQIQLYENKANSDFIAIYLLNFWSTRFFFNKAALIGALIGSTIMCLPPDKNLLSIIGTKLRFGKPSYLKSAIFWWTIGFVIFYLFGFLLDSNNQGFSWVIYLLENGELNLSPTILTDAFNIIFNPSNNDYSTIFIYGNLIIPIINFIIAILIFRAALNITRNIYLRRNDYYVLANIIIIVALFLGLGFFALPTMSLDGINITQSWALIFGFIGLLGVGIFLYIFGRIIYKQDSTKFIIPRQNYKKLGVIGVILTILVITPLFISIGTYINLNRTDVWLDQQWSKKFQREVQWTSDCAGLDMFEVRSIENFTLSKLASNTSDQEILSHIRQYDQDYAVQFIAAKIGTTFEGLADSDIIYFNNSEYWVAPKTVRLSQFQGDSVALHTQLYDHVEGFLALNSSSGQLVNVTEIFGVEEDYPIFFGESESQRFLRQQGSISSVGAFDNGILLYTEWGNAIPNNKFNYTGEPDGLLTGLEGFWYTASFGLWGYVFQDSYNYLINRNVKERVSAILLPGLRIDSDPYLVFDSLHNKMYYAVSIFTSLNIGSYAQFPLLRFLGVCLVDVMTGELEFYRNPNLSSFNDPTYPLWHIYTEQYDWQITPAWLEEQLRYPEDLYELQLEANYIYHVDNPTSWRRADDFQERPEEGDVFYIETDVGDGIEYVGLDLVEYKGIEARTLAGIYMVRHGAHLGEGLFYSTKESLDKLIGPKTARDTYTSEASQELFTVLNRRNGNTLIYPLGGSIYYYIPTYSNVSGLQELQLAGFVEAFTREVGYGSNAFDAYSDLENFPPGTFTLISTAGTPDIDGDFLLNWSASSFADSYSVYQNNSLIAENLPSTQRNLQINDLTNGIYEYYVIAKNNYGTKNSNNLTITVSLLPLNFDFEIDESMTYPSDLASFRIELDNFNTNYSASPIQNIQVNLTLFTAVPGVDFSIQVPPAYSTSNSTYSFFAGPIQYFGINFTIINSINLNSGEILGLNGLLNCSVGDILVRYRWTLIVDGLVLYTSAIGILEVLT
jgi:hypothetical protein